MVSAKSWLNQWGYAFPVVDKVTMDAVQRDKHLYQETLQMLETTILQPTIGTRRALDSGRPMFSSDEAEPILGVESMRKTPKQETDLMLSVANLRNPRIIDPS